MICCNNKKILQKILQIGQPQLYVYLLTFNPFPNKPWSLRVCSTGLLKTLREMEKLLMTSNFSFSHSVFYQFEELSAIFIKFEIAVCQSFQFGSLKFFIWERVNTKTHPNHLNNEIFMFDCQPFNCAE